MSPVLNNTGMTENKVELLQDGYCYLISNVLTWSGKLREIANSLLTQIRKE